MLEEVGGQERLWRFACQACGLTSRREPMLKAVDQANEHNRRHPGGDRLRWAVLSMPALPGAKAKHGLYYGEKLRRLSPEQLEGLTCVRCGEPGGPGGADMCRAGYGPEGDVVAHGRCGA